MLTRTTVGQTTSLYSLPYAPERPVHSNPMTRTNAGGADVHAICKSLTARQREVLAVMMQGKSNKGICRALNLAEPTVENYVTAILKALNVTNRTEAVLKVTNASVTSMSYAYTISGYPTFSQR